MSIYVGAVIGAWSISKGMGGFTTVWHHAILAFGGGALVSAVGLVLVPDGVELMPVWVAASLFMLGGLVFLFIDVKLSASGTPLSQVVATLLDFIPEALVLGAVIAMSPIKAMVIAVIISAQNIPEGYAAYCQIHRSDQDGMLERHPLVFLAATVILGPISAVLGYYAFTGSDPSLGGIMLFCAGGILYIVFRDIAPMANIEKSPWPAFGAVAGFSVGLVGLGIIH